MFKVAALENGYIVSQHIFNSIEEVQSWKTEIQDLIELLGWTVIYLS
jgi:hypothetical protein